MGAGTGAGTIAMEAMAVDTTVTAAIEVVTTATAAIAVATTATTATEDTTVVFMADMVVTASRITAGITAPRTTADAASPTLALVGTTEPIFNLKG